MISEGEIAKERTRGDENRKTAEVKGQFDIQIAQINGRIAMDKFEEGEERKDKRTKLQATQQSRLIDQRANNKSPQDFEEDEMEMEEFELEED
jgi:hypothetical protein